jgi:wyosine [tRNA(Phe)-imidazoG37] synthetase (radical SAM superfamily)
MSDPNDYHYVFGPVTSGRLGVSLGLDLLGRTVCSYDCLYCEVGRTREKTLARAPYVDPGAVLDELARWAAANEPPDAVTLGGMGEPCLNSGLGALIDGARAILPHTPVAVLTNSSLLHLSDVAEELARADVVLPSMDTLVDAEFRRLNQPAEGLDLETMARALLDFGQGFSGRLFLEVLLCAGVNDSERNLALMRDFCGLLRPDRVDVVTLNRPGAYPAARAVDTATLARWRDALAAAPLPSTARTGQRLRHAGQGTNASKAVLQSLRRRPQTAPQLASSLGLEPLAVHKALESLAEAGHIQIHKSGGAEPFFRAADQGE